MTDIRHDETALRILHVEDDPHDRELAAATLAADGLVCRVHYVESRADFEQALLTETFDVVLADYSLPSFDGLTAQAIARRLAPAVPFIFLSGTLGEELAIERLKEGATDYVLKQRITRLPAAILRARQEAVERAERLRAEHELRRLNRELEQRVAERTSQLTEANAKLARREAKLRDSEHWLESILAGSPAAIYVKDLDGQYLLVNDRFSAIVGRPREEILGRTDHEVFPPRMADQYRTHDLRVAADRRALEFDEPALLADGIHVMAATKFPLVDAGGAITAICGFSADITERKKMEDELRLTRLEAYRANLAKSEFLSRMSHDLRTPLNAILGFAQLLAAEDLREAAADGVSEILHAGQHLLNLINEVLDITRIESGHLALSPEPVHVGELLDRTIKMVRPLAAQRGLILDARPLSADIAVMADRQRLGQIVINLLSNAVKYNRPSGRVTVSVEPHPDSAEVVRIAVSDTGAGIPQEKLRLLFQPFERLGAESTAVEGTGLGLALSRALAHAMGGRMGVESRVNEGTTFWIELQVAAGRVVERTDQPAAGADRLDAIIAREGTVLYIEDNPANLRLMSRILERRPGLTLLHAPDGASAFAMVKERIPDLILLDLHLPDIPGEEILRRLWADPATRVVPKVVVTADGSPGLARHLQAAGAVACMTKPLTVVEVLRMVDNLLRSSSSKEEAAP